MDRNFSAVKSHTSSDTATSQTVAPLPTGTTTTTTDAPQRLSRVASRDRSSGTLGSARLASDDGDCSSDMSEDDSKVTEDALQLSSSMGGKSSTAFPAASVAYGESFQVNTTPRRVVTAIPIFQDPNLAVLAQQERLRNRSPQHGPFGGGGPSISATSSAAFESENAGGHDEDSSAGAADGSFFYSDNRSTPRGNVEVTGLGTGAGLLTRGAAGTAMRRLPDGTLQDQRGGGVPPATVDMPPFYSHNKGRSSPKPVAAIGTVDEDDDAGFQVGVPLAIQRSGSFSTVATLHDVMQGEVLEDPLLAAFRAVPEPEQRYLEWMNLETFARGHAVAFATDSEGSRGLQAMITEAFGSIWSVFAKRRPTYHNGRPQKTTLSELASRGANTAQLQGAEREEVLNQLNSIFLQLVPYILDLSEDPFANYVVQKFLETQSPRFVIPIVQRLRGHCFRMTLNNFACRVLQNIIESCVGDRDEDGTEVPPPADMVDAVGSLLRELGEGEYIYRCVLDQNGNHVLQKCLMYVPDEVSFIADRLRDRFMELSQHVYGSRVIQCVYEEMKGSRISFDSEQACLRLMVLAFRNIKLLINTQFGNFVVGHALVNSPAPEAGSAPRGRAPADPEGVDGIVDRLAVRECLVAATLSRASMYSRSKYSSNVVQRAIECASLKVRIDLVESFLQQTQTPLGFVSRDPYGQGNNGKFQKGSKNLTDFGGLSPEFMSLIPEVGALMMDPYGNYVVQTLITSLTEEYKERILHEIQPYVPAIIRTHCGKHLMNKIAPQLAQNVAPPANSWNPAPPQQPKNDAIRVGAQQTNNQNPVPRQSAVPSYTQHTQQHQQHYANIPPNYPRQSTNVRKGPPPPHPSLVNQQQQQQQHSQQQNNSSSNMNHRNQLQQSVNDYNSDNGNDSQQGRRSSDTNNTNKAPDVQSLLAQQQQQQLLQQQLMFQQMLIQQQQAALSSVGWGGMGGGGMNNMMMQQMYGMGMGIGMGGFGNMGGGGMMGGMGHMMGNNNMMGGMGGFGGMNQNSMYNNNNANANNANANNNSMGGLNALSSSTTSEPTNFASWTASGQQSPPQQGAVKAPSPKSQSMNSTTSNVNNSSPTQMSSEDPMQSLLVLQQLQQQQQQLQQQLLSGNNGMKVGGNTTNSSTPPIAPLDQSITQSMLGGGMGVGMGGFGNMGGGGMMGGMGHMMGNNMMGGMGGFGGSGLGQNSTNSLLNFQNFNSAPGTGLLFGGGGVGMMNTSSSSGTVGGGGAPEPVGASEE